MSSELETHWRRVARHFPAWTLPFDFVLNAGTYHFIGSDLLRAMRADPRVKRALKALGEAPPELLAPLAKFAELNSRRCEDAFKLVALSYITVPVAIAALVSEAAPEFVRESVAANLDSIAPIVAALVLTPIVYFCGHWRAKQIVWTIDLYCAEAPTKTDAP